MEGESITIHPISKKTKEPYERSVHYDFKEDKIAFEEFGKKSGQEVGLHVLLPLLRGEPRGE